MCVCVGGVVSDTWQRASGGKLIIIQINGGKCQPWPTKCLIAVISFASVLTFSAVAA